MRVAAESQTGLGRFQTQTLIPCLLTHSTTDEAKSNRLYMLNRRHHRGSASHQTDISQQKNTWDSVLP